MKIKTKIKLVFVSLLALAIVAPLGVTAIKRFWSPSEIDSQVSEYLFPELGKGAERKISLSASDFPDGKALWSFSKDDVIYPLDNFTYYHVEKINDLSIKLYPIKYYDDDSIVNLVYQNIDGSYAHSIRLKITYIAVTSLELSDHSLAF
jgi:hypothetical protein